MSKLLKSKLTKIVIGFVVAVLVLGFANAPKAQALDAGQCAGAKAALVALGIPASTADTILAAQCGGSSSSASYSFTKNLSMGMTDSQVMSLQQFLNGAGFTVATSGTGSKGMESSYFGAKTKAAVMAFQAAQGISPVSGFWGALSRAAASAWMASHGSSNPSNPSNPSTPVTTGPVSASLAAGSPSGSAIAGAGQIDSLKFNVTASSAGGDTLTGLTFTKAGVVSDSAISNLYLADESGVIVAQFASLNSGVATFSNLNIQVNAGQTRTLTLRTDLSTSSNAGNTLAWNLTAGTLSSNATLGGLPVNGNQLTVTTVTNPSISTATMTFNSVGNTVDAGTTGVQVASVTANVNNSAVWLKSVKFSVVGSANWSDIKNVMLKVNGTQVGSTLATVAADGSAVFSLSTPVSLSTGNSTIEVYADVMGSPNRTAEFTILRPYDVNVVDSQYNTGISPTITTTNVTNITINQGQITVSQSSDTPTGNIPVGVSNVTLAKFNIYAAGEPVKVKFLDAQIVADSTVNWASSTSTLKNVKIIDNAGNQIGSTISTAGGAASAATTTGTCTTSGVNLTCHFGDSSSQINYIVPANTTRVLSVVVDVPSTDSVASLQAKLPGGPASNLEGQTSFQTSTSGTANGATLAVISTPLSAKANSAVGTQTYVGGAAGKRVASFAISASSAEGAKISSLTFTKSSTTDALDLQNLKVMVGSSQFGATRTTIADAGSAGTTTMSFSGTTINVPAGGSVTVDLYADILTSSTSSSTYTSVISMKDWSALGATSNSAISLSGSPIAGQNVTISSGAALTVSADSSTTPVAKTLVMGTGGNDVYHLKLQETSNVEDVKVTDLIVTDNITGGVASKNAFTNMTLWDGSTQVGGGLPITMGAGTTPGTVHFSFTTPIIVPRNGTKVLTLKGDVGDQGSITSAQSNSQHVFTIATTTTDVVALGKDSNAPVTVTASAAPSNTSTIAQTSVTVAGTNYSGAHISNATSNDLATITFSNSTYQATVNTVTLKFSGAAVSGIGNFAVKLVKDNDPTTLFGSSVQTNCNASGTSCSVSFAPGFVLSANGTQTVRVRVDSSNFVAPSTGNQNPKVSVSIDNASDVTYNDGVNNFNLDSSGVPGPLGNSIGY